MDTQTLEQPLQVAQAESEWKTEEYHGKLMHVRATLRSHDNPAISGHGQQWDFTVNITDKNAGPTAPALLSAQSNPDLLYSTQAIAESMGFLRGRELIENT